MISMVQSVQIALLMGLHVENQSVKIQADPTELVT
jgi:hypothetical protein